MEDIIRAWMMSAACKLLLCDAVCAGYLACPRNKPARRQRYAVTCPGDVQQPLANYQTHEIGPSCNRKLSGRVHVPRGASASAVQGSPSTASLPPRLWRCRPQSHHTSLHIASTACDVRCAPFV